MFNLIWKLIPSSYKWQVAIKKISYTLAKVIATGIVYVKIKPALDIVGVNQQTLETGLSLLFAAGLEWVHDWAKVKWPDNKFI